MRRYGGEPYAALKQRYDPDGRLLDLYAKAVQTSMTIFGAQCTRRPRRRSDRLTLAADRSSLLADGGLPRPLHRLRRQRGRSAPTPRSALHLATPRGAAYLATAPGDLGLARAYVAGDLEVEGVAPRRPVRAAAGARRPSCASGARPRPSWPDRRARWARSGCARRRRRRRRRCPGGAGRSPGCGTRRPATPRRSTTTTTCRTRSTRWCSARR